MSGYIKLYVCVVCCVCVCVCGINTCLYVGAYSLNSLISKLFQGKKKTHYLAVRSVNYFVHVRVSNNIKT